MFDLEVPLFTVLRRSAVCLLVEHLIGWYASNYFLSVNMISGYDASESEIPKTKKVISQAPCNTGLKMSCV